MIYIEAFLAVGFSMIIVAVLVLLHHRDRIMDDWPEIIRGLPEKRQ